MFTGTFALLHRALRVDGQHPRSHALRIGSVFLILLLLFIAHWRKDQGGAPGLGFFADIARLGMGLILLAGTGYFVTAITEEKEEGTLGLLLLANMSPFSILLGKSTSRVLSAWLMFVAQFPFALLALTLGGINVRQIVATYVALAMFLFLIANLALLASVCARRTTQAVGLMLLFLFAVLGSIPWLNYQLHYLSGAGRPLDASWGRWGDELFTIYQQTSTPHRVVEILQVRYHGGIWGTQATFSLGVGLLAFFLSWAVFRRVIWDVDVTAPQRVQAAESGSGRVWNSVPRPWRLAIAWKDFHIMLGGFKYWGVKLLVIPLFVAFIYWKADWVQALTFQEPLMVVQNGLFLLAGLELLYACSQLYHSEHTEGTLPNLLMLPQSTALISYSKLLGCFLAIAPTVTAALAIVAIREDWIELGHAFLIPQFVAPLGVFLVLCHLSVLCSLYVKWGGTALAIGILFVIVAVTAPVLTSTMKLIDNGELAPLAQIAPLYYITLTICGALQVAILFRLEEVAGG